MSVSGEAKIEVSKHIGGAEPINVVAVQPRIHLPYPTNQSFDPNAIKTNVAASVHHIGNAKQECAATLVAFPEFFLTGFTLGVDVEGWVNASIQIPGPETDAICEAAVQNSVYVAACAYERIDKFPGRFFNTAFVIDPKGEIILTYRKLYAMTSKTRPIDVYDEWVAEYGVESLFPVVDTPIGRIAALIARDAHWPEMARTLALRGAEILYNPNAAEEEPDDASAFVRRSRAYENHCYLISPNIGPFVANGQVEDETSRAPSEIINYRGQLVARKQENVELFVEGHIDIEALRAFRAGGNPKGNFLAQLQPQLHAPFYERARLFPSNHWKHTPIMSAQENKDLEMDVIRSMFQDSVLVAPCAT